MNYQLVPEHPRNMICKFHIILHVIAGTVLTLGACHSSAPVLQLRDGSMERPFQVVDASSAGTGGAGAGGFSGSGGSGSGGAGPTDAFGEAPLAKTGTPCRSQDDCGLTPTSLYCLAPDEPLGCGTCQYGTDECAFDRDCASDAGSSVGRKICDVAPESRCFCMPTRICLVGCRTDTDCQTGQGCNSNHVCKKSCAVGAACPVDFTCGTDGFCQIKMCTSDSECSAACVKGTCYGTFGTCVPPVT